MRHKHLSWVLMLTFILSVSLSWSVITDYTFASQTLTYTEISGGTVLGTTANNEQVFNAQPIGFSFSYNEIAYQNVSISSNGFLAMGDAVVTSNYAMSTGTTNNVVVAMNRDLMSRTNGELSYLTSGTAPNREFTVQWKNYRRTPSTCANDTLNVQIKLFETTNIIEFSYGYCKTTNNATAATVQVGLRGAANTEFINRTTTTNWAATTAGTANNSTCYMNNLIVPPNGLRFTWTPPPIGIPPFPITVFSPANNASALLLTTTLSWVEGQGNPTGYRLYFGTDNPPTNIVNGTIQTGLTYDPNPDLTYSTVYYWQVIPFNNFGDAVGCPIWTFSAMPNPLVTTYPFVENWDAAFIPNVPTNWTVFNTNGDNNTWVTVNANANSDPNALRINYNPTTAMDDWFISPPFQLTAGENYRVRFQYKAQSPTYTEKMEVKLGLAPTINAMTTQIWNNDAISNTAYEEAFIPIYPDTSGIFYVGWHGYSDANRYQLYVDDIRVETFSPVLPGPQNLTAITGNGSVVLHWNSPAPRTLLGYKVYRDGIALTPQLISDTTYVDTTALWGTFYDYYATATYYIPTGESAHSNTVNIMPEFFAPTGLSVATGNGSVIMNWTAPGPLAPSAYNIYRNWSLLLTTPTNATTYIDTTATIGSDTVYNISAAYTNPEGESETTNPLHITPLFNPPTDLQATATTTEVSLSWTAPAPYPVVGYNVYRGADRLNTAPLTATQYVDNTGIPGQTYAYTVKAVYTNPTGESGPSNAVNSAIVGNDDQIVLPAITALTGNTPNPFNPSTTISYSLKADSPVVIEIYNQKGQLVRSFQSSFTKAGYHHLTWDGTDERGSKVSSGVYLYKMLAGSYSSSKKMILMK